MTFPRKEPWTRAYLNLESQSLITNPFVHTVEVLDKTIQRVTAKRGRIHPGEDPRYRYVLDSLQRARAELLSIKREIDSL